MNQPSGPNSYAFLYQFMLRDRYKKYQNELTLFEDGKSKFAWDELEELITEDFEEEKLTSEEFDSLMRVLMSLDCE